MSRSMERVHLFWSAQVAAEYSSAAGSTELAHWLCKVGASPDLIVQCLAIAQDEVTHAVVAHQVAVSSGHTGVVNAQAMLALDLPRLYPDLRRDLVEVLVRSYCFGETIAVPLFSAMRRHTTQTSAVAAFERILKDEPRHSEFGWLSLAWLNAAWPDVRGWIGPSVEVALRDLASQYFCADEYSPALSGAERAWGMLPRLDYASIFERTVLNQCARRFDEYGVDTHAIWEHVKTQRG